VPDEIQRRHNAALWTGSLLTLLGIPINVVPSLVSVPGQRVFAWLGLLLPALGVAFLLLGLKRAFGERQVYGGRVSGSIITFISFVLFAFSVFGFMHARAVPPSSRAPQVGQKAPDFILPNTGGQAMSLAQFLSMPIDSASGKGPKGVLLVFYRGYW
jgi:hypothetical protein